MSWINLSSLDQLTDIKSESFNKLVIIFKHSTRCSISKMVLSRFEREYDLIKSSSYFLDLLTHRDISDQISSDFDVKHESPQLLILKDGQCVGHASHNSINNTNPIDFI